LLACRLLLGISSKTFIFLQECTLRNCGLQTRVPSYQSALDPTHHLKQLITLVTVALMAIVLGLATGILQGIQVGNIYFSMYMGHCVPTWWMRPKEANASFLLQKITKAILVTN
jgi:hypothetical protein